MNEGQVVSSRDSIPQEAYEEHFDEYQVPHSNALQSRRKGATGDGAYFVGPLARWNLNADRASASVREVAAATGLVFPNRNPFVSIVTRGLEVLLAVEEAMRLISEYDPPREPFVPITWRAGGGQAITEAPRGILYNHYEVNGDGLVRFAKIVPPTSQNQLQMEQDLVRLAPQLVNLPDEEAALRAENAIRNYDPCISCATHFLKFRVDRQ